jgi:hypothetical protein
MERPRLILVQSLMKWTPMQEEKCCLMSSAHTWPRGMVKGDCSSNSICALKIVFIAAPQFVPIYTSSTTARLSTLIALTESNSDIIILPR